MMHPLSARETKLPVRVFHDAVIGEDAVAMETLRAIVGGTGHLILVVATVLWAIAGLLLFLAIPLALLGAIAWTAVLGWLVLMLVLAGLRFVAAAMATAMPEADTSPAEADW